MKLRQHQFSTQAQTSDLQKPNPPNRQQKRRAKFRDKTYHAPVRSGGDQPIVRAVQYLELADTIIGHNIIGFDIPVIKKIYPWFKPKGRVVDTLLLSRLYHADMLEVDRKTKPSGMPPKLYGRHSLESYGYRLGEYKGDFGQTSDWLEWSKEMEDYCVQDTIVTKKLCQHFHPYLIGSN